MSGYAFDANILIDAINGIDLARAEIWQAHQTGSRIYLSRVAWIEVLSKGGSTELGVLGEFLLRFTIDELDATIAARAAALRRQRARLKSADAIILASAQVHHRVLVTRNTKDFPADMPGVRVPYTL